MAQCFELPCASDPAEVPPVWIKPVLAEIENSQPPQKLYELCIIRRNSNCKMCLAFSRESAAAWACVRYRTPPQHRFLLPSCRQLPQRAHTCICTPNSACPSPWHLDLPSQRAEPSCLHRGRRTAALTPVLPQEVAPSTSWCSEITLSQGSAGAELNASSTIFRTNFCHNVKTNYFRTAIIAPHRGMVRCWN